METIYWVLIGLLAFLLPPKAACQDTLIVAYTEAAPFILQNEGHLEGPGIWLWNQVSKDLDQPFRLQEMAFSKILNGLASGAVDISINPLTITSTRAESFNFTLPFFIANSTLVIKKEGEKGFFLAFLNSLFSPTFLRGVGLLIAIILLFGIITWRVEHKKNPDQFRKGWQGVFDGLWWSAVTMTTVGYGDKTPKSQLGKVIALIWMFVAIIFLSSLTASIASSLTVTKMEHHEKRLADFRERKIGTVKSSGTAFYLRNNFFRHVRSYDGLMEGLQAVRDGEVSAFAYDKPIMKYRINESDRFQKLYLTDISFNVQQYAWGLSQRQGPLKDTLSKKILKVVESADWQRALSQYNLKQL